MSKYRTLTDEELIRFVDCARRSSMETSPELRGMFEEMFVRFRNIPADLEESREAAIWDEAYEEGYSEGYDAAERANG